MRNQDRYKTAQERAEAFKKFCLISNANHCGCKECSLYKSCDCHFAWLDLEAEEEKPLPCPFCGSDNIRFSMTEDTSDGYTTTPELHCNDCGASVSLEWEHTSDNNGIMPVDYKNKLLAKWNNRVAKAVKESEVNHD